ncbi:MAG: TetR/AcrR family transcriptional regulator, partial [Bacteroidia bacterium]|nr:TetR/AcrR family transcriptional regulator [Bacteroidia bacterium]
PPLNPIHFLMNLVGLVVFPFIAQPMITAASGIPEEPFYILLQERKQLIPKWIEAMLQVKH